MMAVAGILELSRLPSGFGQAADDAVGDGGSFDFQGDLDVGPGWGNWDGGRRWWPRS